MVCTVNCQGKERLYRRNSQGSLGLVFSLLGWLALVPTVTNLIGGVIDGEEIFLPIQPT